MGRGLHPAGGRGDQVTRVLPVAGVDGGRDGLRATDVDVGGAAGVPELANHLATFGVDGVDDFAPASNLLVGEEARSSEPAATGGGDVGGLAYDKATAGGALAVILGHEVAGYVARQRGARTGEGSHNDTVAELDGSEIDWGEKFPSGGGAHARPRK